MAASVGKAYPPTVYAVGREKVREYALAVGETNPVHLDGIALLHHDTHFDKLAEVLTFENVELPES